MTTTSATKDGDSAAVVANSPEQTEASGTFCVGDAVCVFRRSRGEWSRDGVIVKVLLEPTVVEDGLSLPEGAVKVLYDDQGAAKWVPPAAFYAELKHADFLVGDAVSVFCRSMNLWVADGFVDEVLSESRKVDNGLVMPAGSVKVIYAFGDSAKWIPPTVFSKELRAQRRWSDDVMNQEEVLSVSGVSGAFQSVNGRYMQSGMHKDRPMYKNRRGAIIFFDHCWKMNDRDDMLDWDFEVDCPKDGIGMRPPAGEWAARDCHDGGKDQPPAFVSLIGEAAEAPGIA